LLSPATRPPPWNQNQHRPLLGLPGVILGRVDVEIETVLRDARTRELAGLVLDAGVAEIDRQKRFAPFGRRLRRPPTKITDRRRRVTNAEKFGDVVRVNALDRAIAGLNLWGVHGVRRNGRDGQKTHQAHYSDRVSRKPSYPRTFQHADLPVLVRRTACATTCPQLAHLGRQGCRRADPVTEGEPAPLAKLDDAVWPTSDRGGNVKTGAHWVSADVP